MYSADITPKILFTIFFLFISFASCDARGNMEFSRTEALENLKNGEIGFILAADISRVHELSMVEPSAPFYAALLVGAAGDNLRSARLFEAALSSPIPKVRSEAARRLIPILAQGRDKEQAQRILGLISRDRNPVEEIITLNSAALYVLERHGEILSFSEDSNLTQGKSNRNRTRPVETRLSERAAIELDLWNRAFFLTSAARYRRQDLITEEELRSFLLDAPVNEAYRWGYEELLRSPAYTIPVLERTAAAGRIAVSRRAHSEALLHFTNVQNRNASLFFFHTILLNEMGSAYEAIASRREAGFRHFTDWETAIRTGQNSPISLIAASGTPALSTAELNSARYSLLFYAARIRRQQNRHSDARALFTRALALTSDPVQQDACIWNILNSAFSENPDSVTALVQSYAGRWHNFRTFAAILERLSLHLVTNGKWNEIIDVFLALQNGTDGPNISRFAYLAGRAVSLGYVSGRNMRAVDYFTIAMNEPNGTFYYRSMAAHYAGRSLVPLPRQRQGPRTDRFPLGDELDFYVKFFEFGTASYAMSYVRENADRYTGGEMRTIAGTFAASGSYLESIQIMGLYMRRPGYEMERSDLQLFYPRAFIPLIERQSRAQNIHPAIFFGLVRTESAFMPAIASHAGAVGLSQIMPATGREVASRIVRRGGPDYAADGTIDLTNPEINVHMGTVYLRDLINSMENPMLALMGYNGGSGRINRLRRASPNLPADLFLETVAINETRDYGKRVMTSAAAYGFLYYNMPMHEIVYSAFR